MKDMTEGNITLNIFLFSVPMLLGNVFQQLYNVVDSIIVGQYLGKNALAAVGAGFPIMFLLIAIIMGATMGSMVLISQFFGAKDNENLRKIIDTTYILLFIMSIIVTVAGLLTSEMILSLMKTPDDILKDAKLYLDIMYIGVFTMFGYNGISAMMRGVGDSKTPLYLLIVASFLNILLDLLFVMVFKWGIAGAAWATVIAQGFSFIIGLVILAVKKSILKIRFTSMQFSRSLFTKSLEIGIPTGIQQMAVATGMMALSRIVNGFGTGAIAAFTAAGRIDSFAIMPSMNFGLALSTFTGQNIGAGKVDRVNKGVTATFIMSIVVSLLTTIVILAFSRDLIGLFNKDPEVIDIGSEYLFIVGLFYVVFSIMFIYSGVLRGAGDTFIPMLITVSSLWFIRVPISYALSKVMGTKGIWWGIPIAWLIGAVFSFIYYKSGVWKKKITNRKFDKSKIVENELIEETEVVDLERKESRP